jgi:hypothetical protein
MEYWNNGLRGLYNHTEGYSPVFCPTFHPFISEAKIGSKKNALNSIGYMNSETFSYIL